MSFLLSVRSSYLLPCLWTTSICDIGREISLDVDLNPRAVLPHHPQRVQNLPDIQGEQHPEILVIKDLYLTHFYISANRVQRARPQEDIQDRLGRPFCFHNSLCRRNVLVCVVF